MASSSHEARMVLAGDWTYFGDRVQGSDGMSVDDASYFAHKLFDDVCLRSKDYRVYDSSFPDPVSWMPSGEHGSADGFAPIGGKGCELRPGVANPDRMMIAKSRAPLS